MKKVFKIIGSVLLIIIALVGAFLIYVSVKEYKPKAIEALTPPDNQEQVSLDGEISLVTYNIGYGCLSTTEDFFMDGGKTVRPDAKDLVEENLAGIASHLEETEADICLLQEVDLNSKRSYRINQKEYLEEALDIPGIFAYNFNAEYVPYPWPPIGHVESGVVTLTGYEITEANRTALPVSFKWPVSTCNLKRCLLVSRFPVKDSDKELIVINLHLEAYDDGEGKIKQTKLLMGIMEEEYQKGNYVIAGGDFNQTFESLDNIFPLHNTEHFIPGILKQESLPEGFSFAADAAYPTSRLLDRPYSGNYDDTQLYLIDGYIVSGNIKVEEIEVIDKDFEYSDHQPVKLTVTLQK